MIRFQRTMTVIKFRGKRIAVKIIRENEMYQSPHLPGFQVPLAELLKVADRLVRPKKR